MSVLREVAPHKVLHRDERSGIAWIEDGTAGVGLSLHPNISDSGSVAGMKRMGYWSRDAKTKRTRGFIYNISAYVPEDDSYLNGILRRECRCGGNHG